MIEAMIVDVEYWVILPFAEKPSSDTIELTGYGGIIITVPSGSYAKMRENYDRNKL